VCPEKNKSAPKENLFKKLELITICEGKGPKWVREINIDRVTTNNAMLFIVKGILLGLRNNTKAINNKNIIVP
jgi:hypothetical protein